MLVFLAVEREATRERALGVFWPDQEPRKGRHALSQMLYAIRQELGRPWVEADGERLRVADDVQVDAVALERAMADDDLAEVAQLYAGPFLDGWALGSTPEFEHWAEGRRSQCARLHRQARRRSIERLVELGDLDRAVLQARGWTESEPLEPEGQRRLAELLLAADQPAEAAHQLADYRARLAPENLPVPPFVEELEAAARDAMRGESVRVAAAPPAATPSVRESLAPPSRRSPGLRFLVALLGIGAVLTVLLLLLESGPDLPAENVAVMPLVNRTSDPSLDAVGRLAAEWIRDGIDRTGAVRLAAASEVLWALADEFGQEGSTPSRSLARQIGEDTGSGTVVYGSVYGTEEEILFEVEIVDASSGTLLSPISGVRGPISDPMPVIEELRQRVMGALALHLHPIVGERVRIERSPTPRYAAYLAYMQGLELFVRREFRDATLLLERAADLDSTFAEPLVVSGFAAANAGAFRRADSLARRADSSRERLSPYSRHRLDALLAILTGDNLGYFRSLRLAADLAPGGSAHYGAAGAAVRLNLPNEALELFETLDPDGPLMRRWSPYWGQLTLALHLMGLHERELEKAREGVERFTLSMPTRLYELRALAALGRDTEVIERITALNGIPAQPGPSPARVMQITGMELRAHGDPETACEVFERSLAWLESRPAHEATRHRRAVATSLYLLEEWRLAEEAFAQLLAEKPGQADLLGPIGVIAARRGDRDRAKEVDRALLQADQRFSFGRPLLWRARIAAQLGDHDEAVDLIRLALDSGSRDLPLLHRDPDLEPLRGHEAFVRLLRPKG